MPDDYSTWSDAKLLAEQDRLAGERTKVRLAQNAISDELAVRHALAGLSEEARRVFQLRLAGASASEGGKQ